jgi:DNA helicase-2/ATP-dependent DNA helicase PcrA
VRHILDFETKYEGARIHTLTRNYRSAPKIVDAAKRLIRHNKARCDKNYAPAISEPGEIVIRGYSSPEIEARQTACAVAALLAKGYAPRQLAVLYRAGAIGLAFQTAFKDLAIPFEVRGAGDVWSFCLMPMRTISRKSAGSPMSASRAPGGSLALPIPPSAMVNAPGPRPFSLSLLAMRRAFSSGPGQS